MTTSLEDAFDLFSSWKKDCLKVRVDFTAEKSRLPDNPLPIRAHLTGSVIAVDPSNAPGTVTVQGGEGLSPSWTWRQRVADVWFRAEIKLKSEIPDKMSLHATHRDAGKVTVVELSGRITLGEDSALLRKTIRGLLDDQRRMILLNLADVDYIDSAGIGELVSGFTSVKNRNGNLKLLQLTKRVRDLLQITKLYTVFDVFSDESTALRSFE
jgi:anti-sigma B factor antagonist